MGSRPAVMVYTLGAVSVERYEPVLWGLEEEGIPFELRERAGGAPLDETAKEAALGSPLNVGIAVGAAGELALHHRDLPVTAPLFQLGAVEARDEALRRIGANAARLVKGQPLILGGLGGAEEVRAEEHPAQLATPSDFDGLISGIVREVLTALGRDGRIAG